MTGAFGCLPLYLACLARFHVMPPPAKLAEDAGLLHLSLEGLEGPIDAIGVSEMNLGHWLLPLLVSDGDEAILGHA